MAKNVGNASTFDSKNGRLTLGNMDMLKNTGVINHGFIVNPGETIEFPDTENDGYVDYFEIGPDGNKNKVLRISVLYKEQPVQMPVGTLRRMPYQWREKFADDKFALNKELLGCATDYERVHFCFGKKFECIEVAEMDQTVFDPATRRSKRNADGSLALEKGYFPIFKEVK